MPIIMRYKRTILAATALTTLATAGTVLAATHDYPLPATKPVQTTHQEAPTQPVTEETKPVEEPAQPTVMSVTPYSAPAPVTQPETLVVTDKVAAMNAAGIAPEDQEIVDSILTRYSGWKYKSTTDENITLCLARPVAIARFGDASDPVTQLKYCNNLAKAKYGSWSAALTFYEANRYL